MSGLTWSSEAAGEVVRSIWRETLYLMLMRARRTSRPGRDLTCSIRSCQPDWDCGWGAVAATWPPPVTGEDLMGSDISTSSSSFSHHPSNQHIITNHYNTTARTDQHRYGKCFQLKLNFWKIKLKSLTANYYTHYSNSITTAKVHDWSGEDFEFVLNFQFVPFEDF